jgi:quercetin dioxygenase-like cupin family protein
MKVVPLEAVPSAEVTMPGAQNCRVRWLVGEQDGAPNFAMRQFDVAPGGFTPRHSHPYEHEVFVLEGEGEILEGDAPRPLRPGTVVFVAPDEVHQFRNTGTSPLRFLCLVPNSHRNLPAKMAAECDRPMDAESRK